MEPHNRGVVEAAQGALEPEPIPAVQYADDIGLMALYKWMPDILRLGIESRSHDSLLHDGRCPVILWGQSVLTHRLTHLPTYPLSHFLPCPKTGETHCPTWLRLCRAGCFVVLFFNQIAHKEDKPRKTRNTRKPERSRLCRPIFKVSKPIDDAHDSAGNDQSAEWISVEKRGREPKPRSLNCRCDACNDRFFAKAVQVEVEIDEAIENTEQHQSNGQRGKGKRPILEEFVAVAMGCWA